MKVCNIIRDMKITISVFEKTSIESFLRYMKSVKIQDFAQLYLECLENVISARNFAPLCKAFLCSPRLLGTGHYLSPEGS